MRTRHCLTLSFCLLLGVAQAAAAQGYPSKPITIVVPLTAGGPADIVTRLVAHSLASDFKQPVVVENKPGAGGNIGAALVANGAADGYTILCATDTPVTVNPALYKKLSYDPVRQLAPVALLATFAQMLVVHPSVAADSVPAFIELAKRKPVSFASGGNGSPGHLTGEYFAQRAGVKLTHVPYNGNSQAVNDLLGGQVDAGFLATPGVLPHVKAGKLKALGVTSAGRSEMLPDVPAVGQAGPAGFEASFALVCLAPTATPAAVIERLNGAIDRALAKPEVRTRLAALDMAPAGGSPAKAAAYLDHYRTLWSDLARKLNLQLD
ncbi:MAG: Bug family tripartite tricarboxylate transporter substrate binding protein [Burkholderiaceae bacterium]